ncbi:MAG: sigma-54 dependent transcriptional regulator [Deferrisomatales bacterium]|nr:sigma-54 dependent transcriptional regulator [Deferrisomatales bacterium]
MTKILIIDDDHAVRRSLEIYLSDAGFDVHTAADGPQGLDAAARTDPDVVLLDLRLPGMGGFEVLSHLKEQDPNRAVIVITAFDDMHTAIEATKLGASDHLGKPVDMKLLRGAIDKVERERNLEHSGFVFSERSGTSNPVHLIVGRSRPMTAVFKAIGAIVNSPVTVLLQGESGTGKELAAKAIHYNSGDAERPFVAVSCAALAPTLLESELFGHEKGAFTGAEREKKGRFELAEGGTLFLDEISEVSPAIQVKLLRFLQEKEFERVGGNQVLRSRVRVIAATNRDLREMVAAGAFRHDLYFRLKVVTITLPALRERRDDIPLLVRFLLDHIGADLGRTIKVVPKQMMNRLLEYEWPGNVRELENALYRAAVMSPGEVLLPETLQLEGGLGLRRTPLLLKPLAEVEREHIENVLRHTLFHKARAAGILGISRPTLNKRIREYAIDLPDTSGDG